MTIMALCFYLYLWGIHKLTMEQKDFLLQEIERMGQVLSAIRQKLFGGNNNLSSI